MSEEGTPTAEQSLLSKPLERATRFGLRYPVAVIAVAVAVAVVAVLVSTNRLGFRTGQLNVEGGAKLVVNMQRPTGVTATPFTTGGSLADGTYHYVVTALDADGNQTFISDERSCTISGGGGSGRCDLAWTASPGAAGLSLIWLPGAC